jgi:hypothetical protein
LTAPAGQAWAQRWQALGRDLTAMQASAVNATRPSPGSGRYRAGMLLATGGVLGMSMRFIASDGELQDSRQTRQSPHGQGVSGRFPSESIKRYVPVI